MPHRSPVMKTAMELFAHAIEHYVGGSETDRRLAVLHLAHAAELAAKSILITANVPVYRDGGRDAGRTLPARQAFLKAGEIWGVEPPPYFARIELLLDERNSIQHRYGTIDLITIDYHMETAFLYMTEVFAREHGQDLSQYVRESLSLKEEVWRKCRFVKDDHEQRIERAASLVESNTTTALLEVFDWLEETTRTRAKAVSSNVGWMSALDVLMKFAKRLVSGGAIDTDVVGDLPGVFRLRNSVVQGGHQPSEEEVRDAIRIISRFADVLQDVNNEDAFVEAVGESLRTAAFRSRDHRPPDDVSQGGLVRAVATRQLRFPPPRFVGAVTCPRRLYHSL